MALPLIVDPNLDRIKAQDGKEAKTSTRMKNIQTLRNRMEQRREAVYTAFW